MSREFRVHPDCFPCYLKQTAISLSLVNVEESLKFDILKEILDLTKASDISKTPAHTTTFIHRRIRQMLGIDPFRAIKHKYNQIALRLYPQLKSIITESADPLWTASRLAIAGNAIDFGIYTDIDIDSEIDRALNKEIAREEYDRFRDTIDRTWNIIYLLDNAGEIVFDRLLIECLCDMGKTVTSVVKGGPVINDSTLEDACETGLVEVCKVIDNGSDAIGTITEWCSAEFREQLLSAPLIISKGQGNYETLMDLHKDIFFLFQAKCKVVADFLGVDTGAMLLMRGTGGN
jgi:uncharacterized protein with ATP-grasp and redox domains